MASCQNKEKVECFQEREGDVMASSPSSALPDDGKCFHSFGASILYHMPKEEEKIAAVAAAAL